MTEQDALHHEKKRNGKKMKILHLLYESKGDPFGIGGVGIRAYEIYRRIQERHEVTLLCKKYPGARDGKVDGLRHIFVGTESRSLTKTLLSYAYRASQFVKIHGADYDIIVEEFSPGVPTFYKLFIRKPVVLQVQEYTGKLYFRKYNPFYALTLYLMELLRPKFYDTFIFVSPETINKFSLTKVKHIITISNGIAPELLGISPDENDYILYLGRIDIYKKGIDSLLAAYREFFKSFPQVRLVIAGDGRDKGKLESILAKLPEDMRKNIEMPGWVSGDRKRDVIGKALFVVLPSRHESQPIAALEAMGSGKPVVVSDIPEFRFVKDLGAGTEFKTGDARSLGRAMKDLLTDGERKEMGQRGREWVKHYTWDNIALKYEEFLYKIAGQAEFRGTCRGRTRIDGNSDMRSLMPQFKLGDKVPPCGE
jgi:glycosyltransferase involved in cell wall biosynthesis